MSGGEVAVGFKGRGQTHSFVSHEPKYVPIQVKCDHLDQNKTLPWTVYLSLPEMIAN
jgi:hypothetical protein